MVGDAASDKVPSYEGKIIVIKSPTASSWFNLLSHGVLRIEA